MLLWLRKRSPSSRLPVVPLLLAGASAVLKPKGVISPFPLFQLQVDASSGAPSGPEVCTELPKKKAGTVRLVLVSDTHAQWPKNFVGRRGRGGARSLHDRRGSGGRLTCPERIDRI